jgi:hypothetical protein
VRMRPLCWVILIVMQIWFACQVSLVPFSAARTSYRRQEQAAALKAQEGSPSPATRAAVQQVLHLAEHHVAHRQVVKVGVLLAVFLALDLAFIYGRRYYKRAPAGA